ncbi:MAG: adenosine deaminase family protein [Opitutaceae bacterium]
MSDGRGLAAFVRSLPKTETHLHLEGAVPYGLLRDWRPDLYPADPDFRRADHRYADFLEFEALLLRLAVPWFSGPAGLGHYHEAAKAIFADHLARNVRYVETSFHLPATRLLGVPGPELVSAIRSAAPPGLEVRVFAGMKRDDYGGPLTAAIDDLPNWEGLAGVDLHGYEAAPNRPWAARIWRRVREAGKITKCHAGEFGGPERVREAIEELGVMRVEHGVRAAEDPRVVALAVERGVAFDVCPISNVRLRVASSIRDHPLRRLIEAGVLCTVSTDDPLCFGNTLDDEYVALGTEGGFSRSELADVARAGWEVAGVDPRQKASALAEIERLAAAPKPDPAV